MKTYTVYIVHCMDDSYYTGITNDVERRLYEHNVGENERAYTFRRRTVKLVFTYHFEDVNEAIVFEKQIKGWSRKKKEALIQGKWEELPALSKSRPSSARADSSTSSE